jgi:deazaflavin-dependent oxidoreductase (nitroreductase family)
VGIAADLGYVHRRPGALRRAMQHVAASRPGAWLLSKVLPPMDRILRRLTKGRTTLPQLVTGLPVLFVTTTGRRSGTPRTSPLIAVPCGDSLALLGTNFGQRTTPAWALNLEADPSAVVAYRETELRVRARPATEQERDEVWAASTAVYPGYTAYKERITGRQVRIFVLEPAGPS